MMRILFIVPYPPSLIRIRPFNLIRFLAARGHQVTLRTLWSNEQERADLDLLRSSCHEIQALPMPTWRSMVNCLRALPGRDPLQSVYAWQPQLVADLNGSGANGDRPYDVVHVEHLRGVRYGLQLRQTGRAPVVWDSVDCISHLFQQAAERSQSRFGRWATRFELGRTRRYEGWLTGQFDRVLVTSHIDQVALADLGQEAAPIDVLPNGVDLDYFTAGPFAARRPASLIISGKMSYHANVSMALHVVQEIMPRVWAERPDAQLCIVGKDPTRELLALDQNPRIRVTGFVPDMRPYLQQASVAMAATTYGAGIQNKVLEAMACAAPVVATPKAVAALTAVPGQDLLVSDNSEAFAATVIDLLNNPDRRHALGRAGRSFVENNHSWHAIATKLEGIYHGIIRKEFVGA